jgi:Uma2 family endonuclease
MRLPTVFNGEVRVPDEVTDLKSFRAWARSDDFPTGCRIDYLAGLIWIDQTMERLFSHNLVKTACTISVGGLVDRENRGRYFSDGVRLVNPGGDLSPEPDGLFASWETFQSGRLRCVTQSNGDYLELEGTPDMALEVVSRSSVQKDTKVLFALYWEIGIPEYWLIDARKDVIRFDIFKHTAKGYVAVKKHGGWLKSNVFGKEFRLTRQTDPVGQPQFTLAVR